MHITSTDFSFKIQCSMSVIKAFFFGELYQFISHFLNSLILVLLS